MIDKIEIPPVGLLDQRRAIVDEFKALSRSLRHGAIGWSYYLEWAWIFSQFDRSDLVGRRVLDAGAGLGLGQWYLAEHGAEVYSVDRLSRACLPLHLRRRYRVEGLRENDLLPVRRFLNPFDRRASLGEKARNLGRSLRGGYARPSGGRAPGNVILYNHDLSELPELPDASINLIVSTSSLEHNRPDQLATVVTELMRVLRPGGMLVATLAAAKESDWFHAPSHSWCYSESSLKQAFDLSSDPGSNYALFDRLMQDMRECDELRRGLARHYYLSGNNGMPWGRWDPAYLPVGVVKVKS